MSCGPTRTRAGPTGRFGTPWPRWVFRRWRCIPIVSTSHMCPSRSPNTYPFRRHSRPLGAYQRHDVPAVRDALNSLSQNAQELKSEEFQAAEPADRQPEENRRQPQELHLPLRTAIRLQLPQVTASVDQQPDQSDSQVLVISREPQQELCDVLGRSHACTHSRAGAHGIGVTSERSHLLRVISVGDQCIDHQNAQTHIGQRPDRVVGHPPDGADGSHGGSDDADPDTDL